MDQLSYVFFFSGRCVFFFTKNALGKSRKSSLSKVVHPKCLNTTNTVDKLRSRYESNYISNARRNSPMYLNRISIVCDVPYFLVCGKLFDVWDTIHKTFMGLAIEIEIETEIETEIVTENENETEIGTENENEIKVEIETEIETENENETETETWRGTCYKK